MGRAKITALTMRRRAAQRLLILAAIGAVALWHVPPARAPEPWERSDIALYSAIVAGLQHGESYYAAVGSELRGRGYMSREVFNWRTPLHMTTVAMVSENVARGVLITLLAMLLAATMAVVEPRFGVAWFTACVMQAGVIAVFAAPSLVFMSEAWTGVFIGLSVCAFSLGRSTLGFWLALAALFMRELAAPYCVACAGIAFYHRRWREVGAWLGGATAYAVYYAWHVVAVLAHRLPTDPSHAGSWAELGGLTFLLAAFHWLGWLFMMPAPWAALAFVLVTAGVVNTAASLHLRVACLTYAAFFLVAGKPFDHYWGLIVAPSWAVACGYGAAIMVESSRAAFRERRPGPSAQGTSSV